ncbi:hypothetical protein HCU74_00730 [Spongiibacter sp. KMU-166]|uniref:Uncharacterized protein n=1 Tax=Spongiibacter thalassae TaxID=2721624 RepID=A0ABX1GAF0_9GAMM|nr:hypothetical protein [Spongiibacter thalassae]NKI15930.1 hypothetical protein [Spongiibacter thalassae]
MLARWLAGGSGGEMTAQKQLSTAAKVYITPRKHENLDQKVTESGHSCECIGLLADVGSSADINALLLSIFKFHSI